MPARASGRWLCLTSPSTAAPPRWLCARARRPHVPPYRRSASLFCPRRKAELGETIRAAQHTAATPPLTGADPAPRWTLRRLVGWVRARFGLVCCRETIRTALHGLKLSWKKARKLLGRADPERRRAFVERLAGLLADAQRDRHVLVYLYEAHIHQDCSRASMCSRST